MDFKAGKDATHCAGAVKVFYDGVELDLKEDNTAFTFAAKQMTIKLNAANNFVAGKEVKIVFTANENIVDKVDKTTQVPSKTITTTVN